MRISDWSSDVCSSDLDAAERGVYQGLQVTDAATGDAYVTGSKIPRNDNNEAAQIGIRGKFATGPITHEFNLGASHSRYINRNAYEFGPFGPDGTNANNLNDPDRKSTRLNSSH